MQVATICWLVMLILFVVAEAVTVTMVSAWFAAGALTSMFISMAGGKLWVQVCVFFAVSAALLLLLRPLAKKHFTPKLSKTNIDSVIGATGMVTQTIDNIRSAGQVRLGAMEWSARSTDGAVIPEGTLIQVDRIEGVKVLVTPVPTPAETK